MTHRALRAGKKLLAAGAKRKRNASNGAEFEPGFGGGPGRPPPPPRGHTRLLHPGKGKGREREEEQQSAPLRFLLQRYLPPLLRSLLVLQ